MTRLACWCVWARERGPFLLSRGATFNELRLEIVEAFRDVFGIYMSQTTLALLLNTFVYTMHASFDRPPTPPGLFQSLYTQNYHAAVSTMYMQSPLYVFGGTQALSSLNKDNAKMIVYKLRPDNNNQAMYCYFAFILVTKSS